MYHVLNYWVQKNKRIRIIANKLNLAYVLIVGIVLTGLLYMSMSTMEDVAITVEDFSVNVLDVSGEQAYIVLQCVLLEDAVRNLHVSRFKGVKLYVANDFKGLFNGKRKHFLKIEEMSFSEIELPGKPSHFERMSKKNKYKELNMALIYLKLGNISSDGDDIVLFIRNSGQDNYARIFDKAKIVIGKTTVFSFWLHKIFSNAPLFKKAGFLVE